MTDKSLFYFVQVTRLKGELSGLLDGDMVFKLKSLTGGRTFISGIDHLESKGNFPAVEFLS